MLTKPPWLLKQQYVPTSIFPATVCLKTSTFSVSANISSVSCSEGGEGGREGWEGEVGWERKERREGGREGGERRE